MLRLSDVLIDSAIYIHIVIYIILYIFSFTLNLIQNAKWTSQTYFEFCCCRFFLSSLSSILFTLFASLFLPLSLYYNLIYTYLCSVYSVQWNKSIVLQTVCRVPEGANNWRSHINFKFVNVGFTGCCWPLHAHYA